MSCDRCERYRDELQRVRGTLGRTTLRLQAARLKVRELEGRPEKVDPMTLARHRRREVKLATTDRLGREALAALRAGATIAELAARYQVTQSIIYSRLRRVGWVSGKTVKQAAERRQRVTALADQGMDSGEIAREIGISRACTNRSLKLAGYRPARPRGTWKRIESSSAD